MHHLKIYVKNNIKKREKKKTCERKIWKKEITKRKK